MNKVLSNQHQTPLSRIEAKIGSVLRALHLSDNFLKKLGSPFGMTGMRMLEDMLVIFDGLVAKRTCGWLGLLRWWAYMPNY
jgi:hypothetical protein